MQNFFGAACAGLATLATSYGAGANSWYLIILPLLVVPVRVGFSEIDRARRPPILHVILTKAGNPTLLRSIAGVTRCRLRGDKLAGQHIKAV
jgi:hypothetical protein